MLSFMGLSIDTEHSSMWAVMIVFSWFAISSAILIKAQRRGNFRAIDFWASIKEHLEDYQKIIS